MSTINITVVTSKLDKKQKKKLEKKLRKKLRNKLKKKIAKHQEVTVDEEINQNPETIVDINSCVDLSKCDFVLNKHESLNVRKGGNIIVDEDIYTDLNDLIYTDPVLHCYDDDVLNDKKIQSAVADIRKKKQTNVDNQFKNRSSPTKVLINKSKPINKPLNSVNENFYVTPTKSENDLVHDYLNGTIHIIEPNEQ